MDCLRLPMPDTTTVPRARFTVLFPLQRNQTGPQSHVLQMCSLLRNQTGPQSRVLQFCPICRETRQNHSPMFYSSALSIEKPDRTTVPRACPTDLFPLQGNQTGPQFHVLQFCPLCRETRRQHWLRGATLQEQPWGNKEKFAKTTAAILTTGTDLLRQNHAPTQEEEKEEIAFITPAPYLHIPL